MRKDIKGRVAYLKGLAEGLQLDQDTKHGKVLTNLIDVLQEMAGEIDGLRRSHEEVEAYVESLDEDLASVEDDIYYDEDDVVLVEDEDDDETATGAGEEGDVGLEDVIEEPVYFKVECPHCHENVYFEDSLVDDDYALEVTCPNCGAVVYTTEDDFESADEAEEFTETTMEAGTIPRRRLGRRGFEGNARTRRASRGNVESRTATGTQSTV